tara:strand:+ start:27 stop:299 length:273 start_codon:yes stop_codon:yes gene_type:complete
MNRLIILTPKFVMSKIGCNCPFFLLELCEQQLIPHMLICEKENFFTVKIDRCCPCDCDGKISLYRVRKEDFDEFLQKQLEKYIKVFDEEC